MKYEFPAFGSQWTITSFGNALLIAGEDNFHIVTDAVTRRLVPLLDGNTALEQIVACLIPEFGESAVKRAIADLEQHGLLRDGNSAGRGEAAYWEMVGLDPEATARRRAVAAARVLAADGASFDGVVAALQALRIKIDETAEFSIVVTRDYLDPAIAEVNRACWTANQAWMIVRPYGLRQWIGPLFIPGRTLCWECLSRALNANGCALRVPVANLPTTSGITSTMAATEAARWLLTGANAQLEGRLRTIDTARLAIETHTVLRHPDCPLCGAGNRSPVSLESLVSPLTGIVTSIDELYREPGFVLSQARGSQWLRPGRDGRTYLLQPSCFFGAGGNDEEARMTCAGEAVERYSTQYHGQTVVSASLEQLGERVIHPRDLLLYSDRQYQDRVNWNAVKPEAHRVGDPFPPDAQTAWAVAKWFTSGENVFVPAGYCFSGFTEPFCGADSNGCAAAQTWEEAVLRGLLELIERDAVALWWYNRLRRPAIDPEACSRRIQEIKRGLGSRGYRLDLLDLSTDFGVPVSLAVCSRDGGRRVRQGSAAGVDAESAAWRAVLSAAGAAVTLEQGGALPHAKDQEFLEWWLRHATLDTEPYLTPSSGAARPLDDSPRLSGTTPREQLLDCIARVESRELRVAVLDLTRPEIGIPVARVIVPGLRPWWARFAAGRLYSSPVALGWMPAPLKEPDLNPIPFVP